MLYILQVTFNINVYSLLTLILLPVRLYMINCTEFSSCNQLEVKTLICIFMFLIKKVQKSPAVNDRMMKVLDTCGLWAARIWRKQLVKTCSSPLSARFPSIDIRAFLQIHKKHPSPVVFKYLGVLLVIHFYYIVHYLTGWNLFSFAKSIFNTFHFASVVTPYLKCGVNVSYTVLINIIFNAQLNPQCMVTNLLI